MGAGAGASSVQPASQFPSSAPFSSLSSLKKRGVALIVPATSGSSVRSSYELLSSLLSSPAGGVDAGQLRRCGQELLEHAAAVGRLDCIELLLAHVSVEAEPIGGGGGRRRSSSKRQSSSSSRVALTVGGFPLHAAAEHVQPDAVELLLVTGLVDPDSLDPYGQTPLHRICLKAPSPSDPSLAADVAQILALLLHSSSPSAVNLPDSNGWNSPLHHAAGAGNVQVAAMLLAAGGTVDARNKKVGAGERERERERSNADKERTKAVLLSPTCFLFRFFLHASLRALDIVSPFPLSLALSFGRASSVPSPQFLSSLALSSQPLFPTPN